MRKGGRREEIREGGRGDRHVSVVHAVPLHWTVTVAAAVVAVAAVVAGGGDGDGGGGGDGGRW